MKQAEKALGIFGALSAFTAVAAGAFGAHALKGTLDPALFAAFQTGTEYQLTHSLAILIVVFGVKITDNLSKAAAYAFATGIILFSGSLYILSLTGNRAFGMSTPFGGLAYLSGWLLLALSIWRRR